MEKKATFEIFAPRPRHLLAKRALQGGGVMQLPLKKGSSEMGTRSCSSKSSAVISAQWSCLPLQHSHSVSHSCFWHQMDFLLNFGHFPNGFCFNSNETTTVSFNIPQHPFLNGNWKLGFSLK